MADKKTLKERISDIEYTTARIDSNTQGGGISLGFIFITIAMIAAIRSCDNTGKMMEKTEPRLRIENVIGKETPEKFYEINGQKYYLEVDGKPIAEYFR